MTAVIILLGGYLLSQIFLIIQNFKLMGTQAEIAAQLTEVAAQVTKIGLETKATLTKVAELETVLANQANVSPELQAAFDSLKEQVNVVDALVPDAPVLDATVEEAPAGE